MLEEYDFFTPTSKCLSRAWVVGGSISSESVLAMYRVLPFFRSFHWLWMGVETPGNDGAFCIIQRRRWTTGPPEQVASRFYSEIKMQSTLSFDR